MRAASRFFTIYTPVYLRFNNMLLYFIVFVLEYFVNADQSFNYEKLNMYGLGKHIINRPKNIGYPYPEDLPTTAPAPYIRPPYRSVYQGIKKKGDKRVYNRNFNYPPKPNGHHVYCEGVFDCTLSHMAVETNGSIPIIFRGGVGYKYFTVIIKAEPFAKLAGRVRAYCRHSVNEKLTNMFDRFL